MYQGHRIGVSIPAYNEELLIEKTVTTLPDFIDVIVVTDDGSTDRTFEILCSLNDERLIVLKNDQNQGVGAAVVRGFKELIAQECDISMAMAGDAQCDPDYIPALLAPVIQDLCDCAKANRFLHRQQLKQMPRFRFLGDILLSIVTKFSSGYYSIFDPQNGYSAIKTSVLKRVDLDNIAPRYDFENSYWFHLNLVNARLLDIPVPAIYGEETSTIKLRQFTLRTSWTLVKTFWQRLFYKYLFPGFHPIGLFFISGSLLCLLGLLVGVWVAIGTIGPAVATAGSVMLSLLPLLTGFHLLLTAVVLDIMNEPK